MVLIMSLWFSQKATSLKNSKEPKLTTLIALILTFYCVPQGFITGPLPFNIYNIRDMLYNIDICDVA